MTDGATGSQTDTKLQTPSDERRLHYEKPALKHLGSVNKLTLLASKLRFSDGIRNNGKSTRT